MTDPIANALGEFVPPFQSAEGDWRGVLDAAALAEHRSRRRLPRSLRPERRGTRLLVAAAALAVTASATAAIAVSLGAFTGISSAQHPRTGEDVIDPATAAYMEDKNCNGPGEHACQGRIVGLQLDTARHIGRLPDGQNVYVLQCVQNDLCTVIGPPHPTWGDNSPLSKAHPSTIFTYLAVNDSDPTANRWVTFGVALDGVTSVSFRPSEANGPSGPLVTVPVKNNFWVYESQDMPNGLQPVISHFADGTTVVEPATGKNCAAC